MPTLRLDKDLSRSIRLGHPWIFDRALATAPRVQPGAVVRVAYRDRVLAVGFADPTGAIAVRVLGRAPRLSCDEAWAFDRAASAARLRSADPRLARTNAFRAVHGENDRMPGLVVDVYDDTAVAVFDGTAARAFWRPRMGAVNDGLAAGGVSLARIWARAVDGGAAECIAGDPPPARLVIDECGARFGVDVRHGQKTGLFLDHRENRLRTRECAGGAEVLNLFAYSGGFSVHAALAGARRVTSVDSAAPAIAAARDNFAENGVDADRHTFVTEDCFAFLARAGARGRRYDLVIADPPSFAPSARHRTRALAAYRKLNQMALAVVARPGWLVTASCSSHVGLADLLAAVADAGLATDRAVRVVDVRGAASDHPTRPEFPEGAYLDLLVVAVD